jgi:hypothetical protein
MKPNISGLMLASSVPLLWMALRSRRTALFATLAGTAFAFAILWLNHVSIEAMLACYRSAAIGRALGTFGLLSFSPRSKYRLMAWTFALAAPLAVVAFRCGKAFLQRAWSEVALCLLLMLPLPVAIYGMCTNGEVKDSETSVLIAACGVAALILRWTPNWLRVAFVAMLISIIGSNLWYGAARVRVFRIGDGSFFRYREAHQLIHDQLFSTMISTSLLLQVQQETHRAVALYPGPVFFGPRLEFEYADTRLPSPTQWPVYFQPGTSFAASDQARLTKVWQDKHFQTLIFFGDDRTCYPEELIRVIASEYVMEPGFQSIQVYKRR